MVPGARREAAGNGDPGGPQAGGGAVLGARGGVGRRRRPPVRESRCWNQPYRPCSEARLWRALRGRGIWRCVGRAGGARGWAGGRAFVRVVLSPHSKRFIHVWFCFVLFWLT